MNGLYSIRYALSILILIAAGSAHAQVPRLLNYQGRITTAGTNFNGVGQFKFVLVNTGGVTTLWSNNGTSAGGAEPSASVSLNVVNGLYSVLLGDTNLPNMTEPVPPGVFTNLDVRLRVWFNGGSGFQMLTPDQRIVPVGYAMIAANVPDGVITANKLADGAVTASKLASNSVTSAQLEDSIDLGATNQTGQLDVYRTSAGTPGISLFGSSSQISTFGSDGLEQVRLWGPGYGELLLNNSLANNALAVRLSANSGSGGALTLYNSNGVSRVSLLGGNSGAALTLYQADSGIGAFLDGDSGGAGYLDLRSTNGNARVILDGDAGDGGGLIDVRNTVGSVRARIDGQSTSSGGEISVFDADGTETLQILGAESSSQGSEIAMRNGSGNLRIELDADYNSGSALVLYGTNNTAKITLDSDINGDGKIYCDVLQINGGSDLSEKFDVEAAGAEPEPGMLVSIDPINPGKLLVSNKPCDKTVVGVISGAGGVRPGLLMGQAGTAADGRLPVALTGRVYCRVDADAGGSIEPGDLITTSSTPGHGMKVTVPGQAQGAIIGKAMTGLSKGKGLVLVVVSLQ